MPFSFNSIFRDSFYFIKNNWLIFLVSLLLLYIFNAALNAVFVINKDAMVTFMNEILEKLAGRSSLTHTELVAIINTIPTETLTNVFYYFMSYLIVNLGCLLLTISIFVLLIQSLANSNPISDILPKIPSLFFKLFIISIILIGIFMLFSWLLFLGDFMIILIGLLILLIFSFTPILFSNENLPLFSAINKSKNLNFKYISITLPCYLFFFSSLLLIFVGIISIKILSQLSFFLINFMILFMLIFLFRLYELSKNNDLQFKDVI